MTNSVSVEKTTSNIDTVLHQSIQEILITLETVKEKVDFGNTDELIFCLFKHLQIIIQNGNLEESDFSNRLKSFSIYKLF